MYARLWRALPGPWPVKTLEALLLLAGVVLLLFLVVFPWLEPRLPFNDVTVDDDGLGAVGVMVVPPSEGASLVGAERVPSSGRMAS